MEPPPFYRHQCISPPSESPNIYNPHSRQHPPPLPLPTIPPPPLPHHLLRPRPTFPPHPTPPLPTPTQSQFSFRPHHYTIHDRTAPAPSPSAASQYSSNHIPSQIHKHPHHFSPRRDPSHQNSLQSLPFYEENSNFVDRWRDLPPPPRVPTEAHFYHQQGRLLSPIPSHQRDDYINDFERNFRFRGEGFRDNSNRENPSWAGGKDREFDVPDYVDDEKYRYRTFHDKFERTSNSVFERNVHRINRVIGIADSQGADRGLSPPSGFASNVRSYDSYNDRNEVPRWGYSRLGNDNDCIVGDKVSLSPHRLQRESVDHGYNDVHRAKSKMVGHVQEFFNRSPMKMQVQKKSVLLRIQEGKANSKNNYRNRSHDNSRYSRAIYDESDLSFSGSFSRGKGKDVFVNYEGEMDEERERSPVELDVSFKSNALVAKAIKAPSSPVAELDANVATGNSKLKKTSIDYSPRINFTDESVKASGSSCPSSPSEFDEKLKEKIVSLKIDHPADGLDCRSRSRKEDIDFEEKVNDGEINSYASGHDFLSGSNKDVGQLTEKMSMSDHGAHFIDGSTGSKDSLKSGDSDQGIKHIAPDGSPLQRARKRKSIENFDRNDTFLQSMDVLSDVDNSSTGSLSATSQLEEVEGVTHLRDKISLAGVNATYDVISSSHENEPLVDKVNIAPENVVPDVKEEIISSRVPVSLEHSTSLSVSSNLGEKAPYGGPDLVGKLINDELSKLRSDGGLVESQNLERNVSRVQSSYVRRGNSLVRKLPEAGSIPQLLPSKSLVYHLNSGTSNGRKGSGLDIGMIKPPSSVRLGGSDSSLKRLKTSSLSGSLKLSSWNMIKPPSSATSGGSNSSLERLKTSQLAGSIKSSSCTTSNPVDLTFLPLADPLRNDSPGETNDSKRSSEDDIKSSEGDQCETGSSNYLDRRHTGDDGTSGKKISYLKRKSNQLVAASNTNDVSLWSAESSQVFSSEGYFKRRKNQLIRTSLNGSVEHRAANDDKSLRQQGSQNGIQVQSSNKRSSGFTKKKFSLVWTLNGTLSSRKDGSSGRWNRVFPNLFPWKRASYWTNYMHCLNSFSNNSLAISQKLRLSRMREAIYKRSLSGFSLRRSKVLGVGGRNLKWSKSMEKNSRKTNTEATLAVAAAEKQKKAQNLASFSLHKSRNCVSRKSAHSINLHPGERIIRIGSERYKMDPTRKTIQRISDAQNSFSDDQTEKKKKKLYVPRRLLIGNDEYVRIGNGNKLVRDPKRRTRILANEKVRWSLHTARLRLGRKKKYCQFFTRFGKCNKDDRKCPYIHDPSKIAVCTKFLNGSCSNPNCKLTHKVIPERMQDCSYFLQGLCSNENCPYRHVNVNPKSPVCEGFLRGYCADGNECLKKHTHVCPVFEATGSCPQVPECKLHHPKKRKKGTKRRASNLQKNARGRYFGSAHLVDSQTTVCETVNGKGEDSLLNEEIFGDYIGLDVRIGEKEVAFEMRSEPVSDIEEPLDVETAQVDELTKPVRIMNKN